MNATTARRTPYLMMSLVIQAAAMIVCIVVLISKVAG